MGMASGRRFWPLDPRADEVHVEDIALALSNLCRFGGRCQRFYSVAQHCLHVAELAASVLPSAGPHGLLHDAAEAYLGDIIRPLKNWVLIQQPAGRRISTEPFFMAEKRVLDAIYERLGLAEPTVAERQAVIHADELALAVEARDLMGDPRWPGLPVVSLPPLLPMDGPSARMAFTEKLNRLLPGTMT